MSTSNREPKPYNSQKNAELPAGKGSVALSLVSSIRSSLLECFRCMQGYLNELMMKPNEPHGGLEQKLAYSQRDKIRFPRLGNFPRLWWHYTQPQQKAQNDDAHSLPDRIDGKWMCVIWRHKKQGKKAQMMTLPDHVDGKWMCVISGHESKRSDISLSIQLRFVCSWVRLDIYTLPEHNPQNGSAIVEVS